MLSVFFFLLAFILIIIAAASYSSPYAFLFWSKIKPAFKEAQQKVFGTYMLSAFLSIILAVIFLFTHSDDSTSDQSSVDVQYTKEQLDSISEEKMVGEQKHMAYTMSKQFVKEKLLSPATADFPLDLERNIVNYVGDSTFHVKAYVDSENEFGATIRTKYTSLLKYNGGDSWTCTKLNLY